MKSGFGFKSLQYRMIKKSYTVLVINRHLVFYNAQV